jgi:hypothetical protein
MLCEPVSLQVAVVTSSDMVSSRQRNNIGTLSENIVSFSPVFSGECKRIIYFPTLYIVFILQCQKAQDNCQIVPYYDKI